MIILPMGALGWRCIEMEGRSEIFSTVGLCNRFPACFVLALELESTVLSVVVAPALILDRALT